MVADENSINRKEIIYDAAEQVFSRYGYEASRVDEIAQKAGVAKGTIYLYFPSKQELFISLVETRIEEFEHLLEKKLRSASSAEEVLKTIVLTRVQYYMKHMGMVNMLFQTMGQFNEELQNRLIQAKANIKRISTLALSQVLPARYPIPSDVLRAMISGSVNNLVMEQLIANQELHPQEMARQIVNAFLPGIQKHAAP